MAFDKCTIYDMNLGATKAKFCPNGHPQPKAKPPTSKCVSCGKILGATGAKFCPDGHPQSTAAAVKNEGRSDTDDDDDIEIVKEVSLGASKLLPLRAVNELRSQAGIKDPQKKLLDEEKASGLTTPRLRPP
jgi:hypothetical protein